MVLIPPDAGIRMRMETESNLLQPIRPTHELTANLPELQAGQAFTARILESLPDNMFRALVAGKQLTLQLPEGANPGDSLELVVVGRSDRSVIAQRVDTSATPPPAEQPYANANISRAGQMIGQLLLPEGETPQPAPLTRGQPLLPQAPATAAELAPTLAKAVSQSGLFYEAHQAEWVAGRRPIESLQAEPHGQVKASATPGTGTTATTAPTNTATPANTTTPATSTPQLVGSDSAGDKPVQHNPSSPMPDQLRPLVQQQLDAVGTQRLAWHGEVWPGQVMDLQIEREQIEERDARDGDTDDSAQRWSTTLRLSMPRLGTIDATLQLVGNDLRLRLATGNDAAATDLRTNVAALIRALGAAGVSMQAFEVGHGPG
jgi:Flagellar hook-length control protein FliK